MLSILICNVNFYKIKYPYTHYYIILKKTKKSNAFFVLVKLCFFAYFLLNFATFFVDNYNTECHLSFVFE